MNFKIGEQVKVTISNISAIGKIFGINDKSKYFFIGFKYKPKFSGAYRIKDYSKSAFTYKPIDISFYEKYIYGMTEYIFNISKLEQGNKMFVKTKSGSIYHIDFDTKKIGRVAGISTIVKDLENNMSYRPYEEIIRIKKGEPLIVFWPSQSKDFHRYMKTSPVVEYTEASI